ncbi:hypothetical protein JZ751_017659 [Albula glossodonta]|uniref:CWH43-like N-terminal domain-containing protein n=1 Tax=Albula glossodonta TaxID=121402 RepID=A0A8T2PID9_9TELE|nr:hypothetical protein JZ751_017659 [Albula glossodonta]
MKGHVSAKECCDLLLITMFVSSVIMYSSLPGVEVEKKLHWIPGETVRVPTFSQRSVNMRGYTAHIVSTISEWSLALSFVSFFLTYIRDFQKITLRAEADLQSNHLYDTPHYNVRSAVTQGETSPLLSGST